MLLPVLRKCLPPVISVLVNVVLIVFLDSTKLKIVWIKIKTFFKWRVSIILWSTIYVHYFKLPYIGNLSYHIKNKLSKLSKEFCKENFNIKLVFDSFKIKNYFAYKDPIPNDVKSFVVYKFTGASCSSSYIGKTCSHFKIRIEEHIKKGNKSHIFKHLLSSATCFDSYNSLCSKTIVQANSKFELQIKAVLNINWIKPSLNAQQNYLGLTLSL